MKTRMTELFGIKHPIMLSGMNWLTSPKLVAAVSNAGGLGILATQQYDPDRLRASIKEIKGLTDKPFGTNFTMGIGGGEALIPVAVEEKVPVLNYALGKPPEVKALVEAAHAYGGKVIGTVAIKKHALRAEQLGVDMLVVTGYEAAAHSGNIGAIVIIPTITSAVKIPCVGAGGYYDGRSLVAALSLGAEGVAMGTRLAATKESEVPESIKQVWLKVTEEDTVVDKAFDGILCRVYKNKAAENMLKKRFILFDAISSTLSMKKALNLSWPQLIRTANSVRKMPIGIGSEQRGLISSMRMVTGGTLYSKATVEGDAENGLLLMGQGAGRIHDIPSVQELIDRTVSEAEEILQTLNKRVG